jgi:hypothetical protein
MSLIEMLSIGMRMGHVSEAYASKTWRGSNCMYAPVYTIATQLLKENINSVLLVPLTSDRHEGLDPACPRSVASVAVRLDKVQNP